MSTYAVLKRKTANRVGRTDDATANTVRDNAIKDAATQIYQEYKFSWLLKSATLTVSSGVANMPSDYNPTHGIAYAVYEVSGTANDKPYDRADIREKDMFSTSDRVYWITYSDTSDTYVFNSNQDSDTVKIYYYYLPTELSADGDVCICPDDMAVVNLAVAFYWLAKERDEDNYDRFYQKYLERLNKMISNDKTSNTLRRLLTSKIDENNGESILATQR